MKLRLPTHQVASPSRWWLRTIAKAALDTLLALAAVGALVECYRWAPPWVFMWTLAAAVYSGFKLLTWRLAEAERNRFDAVPSLGAWFLWPGMDVSAFLQAQAGNHSRDVPAPRASAWLQAFLETALGLGLVWGGARLAGGWPPLVVGWIGLVGLAFVIHFGFFHLLALAWQARGARARPIMDWPLLAHSVGEFWGRRWNVVFNELAVTLVYRPLAAHGAPRRGVLASFLFSGLIHDLVISWPARGGYGRPTLYFLIQAAGLLIERSRLGRRFGLRHGARGWLFAAAVIVPPVGLLFHPPFIEHVVLPMLTALGAI